MRACVCVGVRGSGLQGWQQVSSAQPQREDRQRHGAAPPSSPPPIRLTCEEVAASRPAARLCFRQPPLIRLKCRPGWFCVAQRECWWRWLGEPGKHTWFACSTFEPMSVTKRPWPQTKRSDDVSVVIVPGTAAGGAGAVEAGGRVRE